MSRKNNGSLWGASVLRRRGWTDEMMRSLLPKPGYLRAHGMPYAIRVWPKKTVLEAEAGEEFKRRRSEARRAASAAVRATDSRAAAEFLARAWEGSERAEDEAWLLAKLYHRGILSRLTAAAKLKRFVPAQALSTIDEFLALRRNCDCAHLTEKLRSLLRALLWLGANTSHAAAEKLAEGYAAALHGCALAVLTDFAGRHPEAETAAFLGAEGFPCAQLVTEGIDSVWSVWYVPRAIRTSLSLLTALNPKDEYPAARAMRRHFVLHLGGTNTGKTYAGLKELMLAPTGVYLAPLRLLALEAQETMLDARIDCSLSTGEEEDRRAYDTHLAATAEKLPIDRRFAVAVIDECQMIADPKRGDAWTRAILGVLAPEIHLCAAPEAKQILLRLIESCGDSYEIVVHERTTPLICMSHTTDYTRVQPGDALITFSKVGVLSVAEDLRASGKEPAIIYGALPYSTRRRQMEGFLNGDMEYIVSTDAIGMGLNLPIRRVIFMETEKFDGVERRALKPEEIKQIAGRAGRRGMYPRGYAGATENLALIRAGLEAVVPPIQEAVVGFSELVLDVDFDLLEVLSEWNKLPTVEPYRKLDITRYISIISKLREQGFVLTKEQELRAANIPFDENEDALRELFFGFMRRYLAGEEIGMPALASEQPTLPEVEQYYRKLDL